MRRSLCALVAGLLLVLPPGGCRQGPPGEVLHLSGQTMGTTWSATILPAPAGTEAAALQQLLQGRLDQLNGLMSTYDPQSELSRFNDRLSSDWFPLAEETARVVALALEISTLTGGAFDVTVGPLVELWGFGAAPRGAGLPAEEQIREALAGVGYSKVRLRRQPPAVSKQAAQLRIDLSAIAKGYAVDALAELLEQQGIRNYLVEIGGEMKVAGRRGDGFPWRIAIEAPLEGRREVAAVFPLTGTALASSGNYRNFYVEDGQHYGHTLDPVSGRPVRHRLASVTVLDRDCARADALATALMVMGVDEGRRFCEEHHVAAYFQVHEQAGLTAYPSPAWQQFLEAIRP